MEQKLTTRSIVSEDWKIFEKWFLGHGEGLPQRNLLPDNGLGGVMVEKDGRPIAATFIYQTNSDIAFLDIGISDPYYKGKDRFEIGNILIKECLRRVEASGYEALSLTTNNKGLLKRFKTMNWQINENMSYCTKYIYNAR